MGNQVTRTLAEVTAEDEMYHIDGDPGSLETEVKPDLKIASVGVQTDPAPTVTEVPKEEAEEGIFTEAPDLSVDVEPFDGIDAVKLDTSVADEEDEVSALKKRIRELEHKVEDWQNVAQDFLFSMALGPEMTTWYAGFLRQYLEEALLGIPQVDKVNFAECSFPSVPKEAPKLEMVKWDGMSCGEWDVNWAPKSWWIALSVTGRQSPLPTQFNAVVTIYGLHLQGRVRTALPNDVTSFRFAFVSKPVVRFQTSFQLNWGRLPVPLRVSIESRVMHALEGFIQSRMLLPNSYHLVVRKRRNPKIDKDALVQAISAAQRARDFNTPASPGFPASPGWPGRPA